MKRSQKISRKTVERYLEKNAPHLALYEYGGGIKGTYRKDSDPAHSFKGKGRTWREVLTALIVRPVD